MIERERERERIKIERKILTFLKLNEKYNDLKI